MLLTKTGLVTAATAQLGPWRLITPQRTWQEDERHKKEVIPAVCWVTKRDEARTEIAMVMQFRGALAAVGPPARQSASARMLNALAGLWQAWTC